MQSKRERTASMIPELPGQATTIDTGEALAAFVAPLMHADWVAIDTEFLRERTYYPKLCLVQLADATVSGVIDVLAIEDLTPLVALLTAPEVVKVFHSAEQDLEVLKHTFDVMPAPLFDTQLAGALVGLDDQMGYARMVEALLGVKLAKGHTRTDWSKRPLPAGAIDYAADDVRYLAVAYPIIRARLVDCGRESWAAEDATRLADPARFVVDADSAWRRVKGWFHLPAEAQPVLAKLAAWRETVAVASDRPRRWILSDATLLALAEQAPTDDMALADATELSDKMLARHTEALLDAIARGRAAGPALLDPDAGPPDGPTRRAIKHGMKTLAAAAEEAELSPSVLASRAEVARLVAGHRDVRLLTGWRGELAGQRVLAAIEAHQNAHETAS